MLAGRKVCYSGLFTNLVGYHAGAVSFPLSDVILAQLACPLSYVVLCLHSGVTYLSTIIDLAFLLYCKMIRYLWLAYQQFSSSRV